MLKFTICPEKTAITNGVSGSCKLLVQENLVKRNHIKVLDYGCGKLRNTKNLIDNKFNTSIIDTKLQLEKNKNQIDLLNISHCFSDEEISFNTKFDVILLSFVLNVIQDYNCRIKILENCFKLLNNNGILYIEVRNDKFLKNSKSIIEFNDGFVLGSNSIRTFQKPYSIDDIENFIESNGFRCILTKKTSNSIIIKAKKSI